MTPCGAPPGPRWPRSKTRRGYGLRLPADAWHTFRPAVGEPGRADLRPSRNRGGQRLLRQVLMTGVASRTGERGVPARPYVWGCTAVDLVRPERRVGAQNSCAEGEGDFALASDLQGSRRNGDLRHA